MQDIVTSHSIDAFRNGSLSASEYLESLYAREEIESKEPKNKKRRRKSEPESAQDDSNSVEATISSIESKTTNRKGPKTRGSRTQAKSSLCQPTDITAADKPAERDVFESMESPLRRQLILEDSPAAAEPAQTQSSQAIDAMPLGE